MDDKRIYLFKEAPISKSVITLALPAIIGLLVMAIYNIVDTMFVAWLGTEATGATQVVFPLIMAIGAVGQAIGIGGGAYVSRLLGEGKKSRAEKVVSTNFYLSIVVGILCTIVLLLFIEPVLKAFGASNSMMVLAKDYGFIIILGMTPQVINMTLNNHLRGEGSAKYSMIAMVTGAVLNIILDPILIFYFDLGIKGAAIATSFSMLVTSLMLISQYTKKRSMLHLSLKHISLDKQIFSEVIRIGGPSFARQILMSISMGMFNQAAAMFSGDAGIAAIGLVMRMTMMIFYVIFGLSQGFQPVAGYNYGAKAYQRLKDAFKFTTLVSFGIACVSAVVMIIFDDTILSIFKPSQDVLSIAKPFIRYFMVSTLLMSISNVMGVYYQAIGKAMPALWLSIARQGIFLIPCILILPNIFGMTGVFLAQPLSDVLTLIMGLIMFIPSYKQLNTEKIHQVAS